MSAALRLAWKNVLREIEGSTMNSSPQQIALCEALSNLFFESGNCIRENASSNTGASVPWSFPERYPRGPPASVPSSPTGTREKATAQILRVPSAPGSYGAAPRATPATARAAPYQRPVLPRFSVQERSKTTPIRPKARETLASLLLRLKRGDYTPGKVLKISSCYKSVFIRTHTGEEVLVDPRDTSKAYIAFDDDDQLQICFPEPPLADPKDPKRSADDTPRYPLERATWYQGDGKSPSNCYLHYRRGFETSTAIEVATAEQQKMLEDFETKYKGKDVQYNNIRHLGDDISWIRVENIIAAVPKKLWSNDNTLDPAAVYEGLLFDTVFEQE